MIYIFPANIQTIFTHSPSNPTYFKQVIGLFALLPHKSFRMVK